MQKNNLKYESPQNQDLTPPKSSLEGVQNLSFEYKNIYYYNIMSLANLFVATAGTNIRNAAFRIVHTDLLYIFTKSLSAIK